MEWWKEKTINRRDYLLDHLETHQLNATETLCLLLIDFMNTYQMRITHDALAVKMKLEVAQVDEILSALQDKGYLCFSYDNGIHFDVNGMFEIENMKPKSLFDQNIFDMFEKEFARTITQREMEQLSEWLHRYGSEMIVYALREALIQDKKSFPYINRILENWKNEGITLADLEGKRV